MITYLETGFVLKLNENWEFVKDKHERQEKDTGIHIVVEG